MSRLRQLDSRRWSRIVVGLLGAAAAGRLLAGDPGPTQSVSSDGNGYGSPLPVNDPFPDAYYGADHGGSGLTLSYPFLSQFGYADHSRGRFVYSCGSFFPRGSEGVFGMDVWLEKQNGDGSWSPAGPNGGVSDQGIVYQPVNTPNPGPSPSYSYTWTFNGGNQLPPNTNWRVFVYVYIYNQGGGSQGDYPVYSATASVSTGSANDAPRISWSPSAGSLNPSQVQAGQGYTVSADGQDDNGNLVAVSINKNGTPFAYAGGGNGYSGNSQNPSADGAGMATYTAWATDSYGAQSPTITWTVTVVGKSNQATVSSSSASFPYYSQVFTPMYYGGSGSGGWQFVVSGYTNWTATGSSTGTEVPPSNAWSPSWTPPAPGTYTFYVARDGDSNFNPSNIAGPYTLTVTPDAPVGSFDGVSPNPVPQTQTVSGSGWAADAQVGAPLSSVQILVDGGANGSFFATLGGSRPDVQSANVSGGRWSPHDLTYSGWSFSYGTSGLSQGTHTFTAIAYDNSYGVSATVGSQTFTVQAPINQSVAIAPASSNISAGASVTFYASGGVNGYVWGGATSGGGGSQTVTFSTPGVYGVTAYSPAGNGYNQSNVAAATVTVNPILASFSASPTMFIYDGSAQGPTIAATPAGAMYSTSGTTVATNAGSYSFTITAGGNYTGSNTIAWSIGPAAQAPVTLSPSASTVTAGQGATFTASGGSGTGAYLWGGSASGTGISQTVNFPNVGNYAVSVYRAGDGNYNASNTATANVTVLPIGQTVAIAPANATVTAGNSITFTASGGQEGYVWGGAGSGSGSTNSVPFPNAGTFAVTVYSPSGGVFARSNLAVASVTVLNPTYTLTVDAGAGGTASGSATGLAGNATAAISAAANSGYAFVAWTGDTPANPSAASTTIAINNADRTVTANFAALQPQTITFNPPATALYPGPAIILTATASSGLPVSFSVLSGPGILSGSLLSFTGRGTVTVQASQAGGVNAGVYYQAAPNVSRAIQVSAPFTVIRLRFNSPAIVNGKSTGNPTVDAKNIGHSAAGRGQRSFIWTDPAGLQNSPWPTFNNPAASLPEAGSVSLPSTPAVTPIQANSVPRGQLTGSP